MNITYMFLVYVVWFLAMYFVIFMLLAMLFNKNNIYEKKTFQKNFSYPFVSFVVSAYNEGKKIGDTIESLQKVEYKNVEFIIINDGSKDNTAKVIRKYLNDKRIIFVDNKKNKGKFELPGKS